MPKTANKQTKRERDDTDDDDGGGGALHWQRISNINLHCHNHQMPSQTMMMAVATTQRKLRDGTTFQSSERSLNCKEKSTKCLKIITVWTDQQLILNFSVDQSGNTLGFCSEKNLNGCHRREEESNPCHHQNYVTADLTAVLHWSSPADNCCSLKKVVIPITTTHSSYVNRQQKKHSGRLWQCRHIFLTGI